jgi:signal recognition particle receptor subunit beta
MNKTKELRLKIMISGGSSTGKTSFIRRYCYPWLFQYAHDFGINKIKWDQNLDIVVQFMVYPFVTFSPTLCQGYHGALFFFDSTNHNSLQNAINSKKSFDRYGRIGEYLVPSLLVATKIDLCTDIPSLNLDHYAKTNGFADSICVSAKEMTNLEESVRLLISYSLPLITTY